MAWIVCLHAGVHEPLNDLIHLLATWRHPPSHGGMHHERIRAPQCINQNFRRFCTPSTRLLLDGVAVGTRITG